MPFTDWTTLDWCIFVSGIAAVGLVIRQHLLNWPVGIVNSALVLYVTADHKLYSDAALQVLYIVLGLYGWWHWLYGNPERRNALPVVRTPGREGAVLAAAAVVFFVGLGLGLDHWTDTDVPWYDAFPTTASLVAQYLLTRKYLETWPVWIFLVNVPYIALYLYKDISSLAVLQPIYIALSIAGWVEWRRSMGTGESAGAGSGHPERAESERSGDQNERTVGGVGEGITGS